MIRVRPAVRYNISPFEGKARSPQVIAAKMFVILKFYFKKAAYLYK